MAWIAPAIMAGGAILGGALANRGGQSSQSTEANPWQDTVPFLQDILNRIYTQSYQAPAYTSPEQMVAGLTPEQQAAAQTVNAAGPGAVAINNVAQTGIQPFLNGSMMNVDTNPYLNAAIQAAIRPITQNYQENVLPQIATNFSQGTDAYDQSREGIARGIASRGYLDAISGVSSQMANRGYETGMQGTLQAFNQVPALTTSAFAPGQAQWNIGALLQNQNQQQLNAPGMLEAYQQNRLSWPANLYTQIGQIGRQGTQVTQGAQGNPYLSAIGGAILGRQVYNMWNQPSGGGNVAPNTTGLGTDYYAG